MRFGLINKSVLIVKGPQAKSLLNGLITQDIEKTTTSNPIYSLFLDNKGKVLFCTIIYMLEQNTYAIEIEDQHLMTLAKHIHKFDISKSTQFSKDETLQVIISDTAQEGFYQDPRHKDLGFRTLANKNTFTIDENYNDEYENTRLSLAIPTNDDFIKEKSLANDLNSEQLNGICFTKGCYLGQEITSKTKHIRPTKNKLVVLDNTKLNITSLNQDLFIEDVKVGQSFSYNKQFVLAIIKRNISDYNNITTM